MEIVPLDDQLARACGELCRRPPIYRMSLTLPSPSSPGSGETPSLPATRMTRGVCIRPPRLFRFEIHPRIAPVYQRSCFVAQGRGGGYADQPHSSSTERDPECVPAHFDADAPKNSGLRPPRREVPCEGTDRLYSGPNARPVANCGRNPPGIPQNLRPPGQWWPDRKSELRLR